jgi:5-methylcytosine-specific restriction enzyme A
MIIIIFNYFIPMIQKDIVNILENFINSKNRFPKAVSQGEHFEALSILIPKQFEKWIQSSSNFPTSYKVTYSHGMGNWAEIPWIVCTNKNITSTPQAGYYIVLGFSADMLSCYLSLNQGVSKTAKSDLSQFAHVAIEYTEPSNAQNVFFGPIDFKAKNPLGRSYEKAAIKSYKYALEELKNSDLSKQIEQQFKELLRDYENIYNLVGKNILDLKPVSDLSYQLEIQKINNDNFKNIDPNFIQPCPSKSSKHTKYYLRNPKYSKFALYLADYKCEFNNEHTTFFNGKHQYMEGHHLVPMSQQDHYQISLDIPANIISLCPNCHRALHYGDKPTKKKILNILLNKREDLLNKLGIKIQKKELIKVYINKNLNNTYD